MNAQVTATRIAIPQADLDDVRDRLARTRFTDALDPDEGYGTSVASVRDLVRHWLEEFDWRALEARLNAYPQIETVIDGQRVHAIHVRSGHPDAVGLILTHGWPGSVVEFLDVIEPLTAAGYDVVIPSIPGYGFSGPTTERGWDNLRVARAWVELMHRLGYERYGAVGNDAGSMISPEVGRLDPEHVIGVHVTQIFSFPSGDPAELDGLTDDEQAALAHLGWFWESMGAFNMLHSQQPQTLAHALADSPAGMLGWYGQLMGDVEQAFVVANAAVYWFTGTQGSALRLYRENALAQQRAKEVGATAVVPASGPTTAPLALAQARGDFASIRRFAERDHADIRQWTTYERGGHFAAHAEPQQTAADVVRFFDSL
jgi:pimeloyl-ACP methyl ester carboxylesterase